MRRQKKKNSKRNLIVWLVTAALWVVYIVFAGGAIRQQLDIFNVEGAYVDTAEVIELGEVQTESYEAGTVYEDTRQYFTAKISSGPRKGNVVLAAQTSDNYTSGNSEKPVAVGDSVVLYNYGTMEGDAEYVFGGYNRLTPNLVFIGIFFALLIVFGGIKGFNTIVSLGFTCLAVFAVFVPSVLAGYNIYLWASITCVYTIIMTLLITNRASTKSFTTILGCTFGVMIAAILFFIMNSALKLTGVTDEHSIYLQYLSSGVEIDLVALIFAMIVIGAMGAVMDVAMDISSSLYEVHIHAEKLSFKELFMSGIHIGRDVMGTMANTLVLAYIGNSLCSILLLITYSSSLVELLNRENIAVEILQAITGSMAILLTIPLTSAICAFLYSGKKIALDDKHKIEVNMDDFKEWKSQTRKEAEEELKKYNNIKNLDMTIQNNLHKN